MAVRQVARASQAARAENPLFPDPAYESSEGVADVLSAIRDGHGIIFVSGRAGTGKSRLIRYLGRMPGGRRQVVAAPTGIAALSLGASTIHTLFRLPVGVIDTASLDPAEVAGMPVLRRMTRLVIDEVSMVRADVMDAIDLRLRQARDTDIPFGGVQVVLVGDFLQLPPVVTPEDRRLLDRLGYTTPFAFSARVLRTAPVRMAVLTRVFRQKDPDMVRVLGDIREGRRVRRALDWLNARCARPHRTGVAPMIVTATRAAAARANAVGLARVRAAPGRARAEAVFEARASGIFENACTPTPAPRHLEIVEGMRVMAVRNDPAGRFANGSLGIVEGVDQGTSGRTEPSVIVRFDRCAEAVRVHPVEWSRVRQVWDERARRIVESPIGVYRQVPLVVGYAITIHKSQGLTLEDVRLDLGRGTFAPGQLYVALSRATSVEGLSFARPLEPRDVMVDEMLVQFLHWAASAPNLDIPHREASWHDSPWIRDDVGREVGWSPAPV